MMTNTTTVQDTWTAYQEAVDKLYALPSDLHITTRSGSGAIDTTVALDERSQAVLDCSQALGDALAVAIDTDNLDQRELVSWKLLAAVAYDLSVAADLLEAEETDRAAGPVRGSRSAVTSIRELRDVLDAPLDSDMSALAAQPTRAALPTDPANAKAQLLKTIAVFLDEVPGTAADMGQAAVSGVIATGLVPAQRMFSVAAQEIMARLPDAASLLVRRSAQVLVEAIRKLRTMLGEEILGEVDDKVSGWLTEIQEKRDTVTALLDRLYEAERVGEEANGQVTAAPATITAEQYNQATKALEELMARYSKTKQILEALMRVLAFVKTPLLAASPWGPAGVYATYISVLTYAIFSGGDYLDWYRLEGKAWLDRVEGLRTTVSGAVASGREEE
jgi:hypothetical protein